MAMDYFSCAERSGEIDGCPKGNFVPNTGHWHAELNLVLI